MTAPVHILCTVRPGFESGLDAALLVFSTLRVGFPTAPLCVWGNGLERHALPPVAGAAKSVDASFVNLPRTSHDYWIAGLLARSLSPFWICDTDIVFHESVETWAFPDEALFAGRFEPDFDEEWTGTRHVARLHTCLMWFDPARTRAGMRGFMARIPRPWGATAQFPFVLQTFVPVSGGKTLLYDTCAGLYHALGGTAFTEKQNDAFDHLYCATYADLISPHLHLPGETSLLEIHRACYANPGFVKGRIKAQQAAYYAARCPGAK